MPSSSVKLGIAEVLKREGFIESFEVVPKPVQNDMRIALKYGPGGERVITRIRRVSRPGRRVYRAYRELKPVLRGLGITVLSTPRGLMSDREAKAAKVGGEVICEVY
jgi:small subunit ribosomal protein S8